MKIPFNKYLYIGFILLGSYQALMNKDYMQAVASFGIGLAFDPFDQQQKWNERPNWQKALLYLHLAVVAGLFGLAVGMNDR
jgi:H+/Cl- antiporter ClcA